MGGHRRIRNFSRRRKRNFPKWILLRVFIMTACPTYRSIIAMQMRHLHAGIIRGKVICIRREIHSYARRKKPRYHLSCLPARPQKPLLLIINRRFALPPLSPLPLLLPFRRRVILKFAPIGTPFYFDILFEIILFNFIILFNDSTICFGTIEFIYGKF